MDLSHKKKINYGRQYFKDFTASVENCGSTICGDPDYDIDGAERVFEFASSLNWSSDGSNVTSLPNLNSYLQEKSPDLTTKLSNEGFFLFLPLRLGRYTGFMKARSGDLANTISALSKADGDGIILVSRSKAIMAIFDLDKGSQTFSIFTIDK